MWVWAVKTPTNSIKRNERVETVTRPSCADIKEVLNLKVGELGVLLLQNVGHVVNQVQTKSVLGGDFLPNTGWNFIHMNTHTHTHPRASRRRRCPHSRSRWRAWCRWSNARRSGRWTAWERLQEFLQRWKQMSFSLRCSHQRWLKEPDEGLKRAEKAQT